MVFKTIGDKLNPVILFFHAMGVIGESSMPVAEKMKEIKVVLKAKAGENGKLFGSVTSKDVAEALTSQHHIKLDKKKFVMPDGIKTLGTTTVDVKFIQALSVS